MQTINMQYKLLAKLYSIQHYILRIRRPVRDNLEDFLRTNCIRLELMSKLA